LNFAETPAQSIAYENQVFKSGINATCGAGFEEKLDAGRKAPSDRGE
jgi:hypothetical protein